MKILTRILAPSLLLLLASVAYGAGMPILDVTVSNESGNAIYKGKTSANGTFATGNVQPGKYVVQFNSRGAGSGQYALVISAGKTKVMAEAVPGSKFAQGGVAMRLEAGKGVNITGQVSSGKMAPAKAVKMSGNAKIKIVDGKKYIWVGPATGSNIGGHWEEEGRASAQNVQGVDSQSLIDTGGRH